MSGIPGATAISSVSLCWQAEGTGGAGAPDPAGLSTMPGITTVRGASNGRGLGKGTTAVSMTGLADTTFRGLGVETPGLCGAAKGSAGISKISNPAQTITINLSTESEPAQGHLRRAFGALNFMTISR